jgi:hypothetical protein
LGLGKKKSVDSQRPVVKEMEAEPAKIKVLDEAK